MTEGDAHSGDSFVGISQLFVTRQFLFEQNHLTEFTFFSIWSKFTADINFCGVLHNSTGIVGIHNVPYVILYSQWYAHIQSGAHHLVWAISHYVISTAHISARIRYLGAVCSLWSSCFMLGKMCETRTSTQKSPTYELYSYSCVSVFVDPSAKYYKLISWGDIFYIYEQWNAPADRYWSVLVAETKYEIFSCKPSYCLGYLGP